MDAPYYSGRGSESHSSKIITPYEPHAPDTNRWCPQCRRWVPVDRFSKNIGHGADGIRAQCRACDNANRKNRRRRVGNERI